MRPTSDFVHQSARLGALTLATSLLGFIREFAIAYKFGATQGTDAYLVALTIPSLLYAFMIGSGLNISVTPRLASLMVSDPEGARAQFSQFLGLAVVLGVVGSLMILAFAGGWVGLFAPGVTSSDLTIEFTRRLSPLFFLFVAAYCLGSFQCARGCTPYWALTGLSQNAAVVLAIFALAGVFGMRVLLIGTIIGAVAALLVQACLARKGGFREPWRNPLRRGDGLKIFGTLLTFALAFGIGGDSGTSQADIFLVRFFASRLDPGSITLLALGNKLMGLPVLLVGSALGLAALPAASVAFSNGDVFQATRRLTQAWSYALFLICPVFVLYLDESAQIAQFIFGHGALKPAQVGALGGILAAYSGAVAGLTLVYVVGSFLAAQRRTRLLISSGVSVVALNAVLMYLFSPRYGARGIALAVSIGSLVYCGVLSISLLIKIDTSAVRKIAKATTLIAAGALAMHLILRSAIELRLFVSSPLLSRGILPGFAGVAAYAVWIGFCRTRLQLLTSVNP